MKPKNKIDVIVEARMASTRLPGKVLLAAVGKPMLELMVERLKMIPEVTEVIIATTVNEKDSPIVRLADRLNVPCFRGSEEDVLGRVVKTAKHFGTEIIVEITGDDPLLDPKLSSDVIRAYLENQNTIDYVANDVIYTFPLGLNTRAFSTQLLESVEKEATHPVDREHVVNYIVKRPEKYRLFNIEAQDIYRRPDIRLTLDTKEDFEVIKMIFEELYPLDSSFDAKDIIEYLDRNPEILKINKQIIQRTYEYK